MGKSYSHFTERVIELLKDGAAKIAIDTIPDYIQSAVADRYSVDRPQLKIYDKAGDGTYTYSLPTDWEKEFSQIRSIEYPKGNQDPIYLTPEDWIIYLDDTTEKLRFLSITPTSGNTIRIIYSLRHVLSQSANTIPDADFEAVCHYAVSLCCRALANYYSQTVDTALSADVINYRTKREEYENQAKVFEKLYHDHINSTRRKSAMIGDWNIRDILGMEYLFHPEKIR